MAKVTNLDKNPISMELTIDRAVFDEACLKAYKQDAKKYSIPGFRKGKATKGMIEKFYGKDVFNYTALEIAFPDAYDAAVKETAIKPVSTNPELEDVDFDGKDGVVVKLKVYVVPEVKIEGYKGIEIENNEKKVTAADVDAEVESVRNRNARKLEITDRAAKLEDTATISYKGTVDGVAFDGGSSDNYDLKLGSGSFIPGFEDQIVGHNVGESFDVNVTFPADYHAKDLAGKAAVFAVELKALSVEELPALDDEFAKDVSEFDTLADYKKDLKKKLQENAKKTADRDAENQVAAKLAEIVEVTIPEPMIANEAENLVRDYDNNLRMQGLDLNTYFKYTGQTLESMRESFKPMAEKNVKTRLALEKIVELEKIEATDEDVENEYKDLSSMYGMDVEKIKELVNADTVKADLATRKAVTFVKDNAKMVEKKAAAPKKSTAKKTESADEKKPAAKKTCATKKTTTASTTAKKTTSTAKKTTSTAKKTTAKKAEEK